MLEDAKSYATIAFLSTATIVTALTYLQARKTLLTPIRTETFKLQLTAFNEVLLYFQNRIESDFVEVFDLRRILKLNSFIMVDAYLDSFFPDEFKVGSEERSEGRKNSYSVFIGGFASEEDRDFVGPMTKTAGKSSEDERSTNPALVLAKWQKYKYGMINFTKEFDDQVRELRRLAASPLLPANLRKHIGKLIAIAFENLELVREVLTESAKQMPEHMANYPGGKDVSITWIWDEFDKRRQRFEPTANNVLESINDYLKVEEIMK